VTTTLTVSLRLDAPGTRYVRLHGLGRATQLGYSVYELEVYPVAEPER
jgi:hyaluronoglucosaminidase